MVNLHKIELVNIDLRIQERKRQPMGTTRSRPGRYVSNNRVFIRITIGLVIVLALASAVAIYFEQESQLERIRSRELTLASELSEAKAEKADLEELQNIVDTDEYIERIARDKLGMVRPNEIVFED